MKIIREPSGMKRLKLQFNGLINVLLIIAACYLAIFSAIVFTSSLTPEQFLNDFVQNSSELATIYAIIGLLLFFPVYEYLYFKKGFVERIKKIEDTIDINPDAQYLRILQSAIDKLATIPFFGIARLRKPKYRKKIEDLEYKFACDRVKKLLEKSHHEPTAPKMNFEYFLKALKYESFISVFRFNFDKYLNLLIHKTEKGLMMEREEISAKLSLHNNILQERGKIEQILADLKSLIKDGDNDLNVKIEAEGIVIDNLSEQYVKAEISDLKVKLTSVEIRIGKLKDMKSLKLFSEKLFALSSFFKVEKEEINDPALEEFLSSS